LSSSPLITFEMKNLFVAAVLTVLFTSCKDNPRQDQLANPSSLNHTDSTFTFQIIDASGKTFGYDIYKDEKLVIHQPHIPAIAGNEGFKTSDDAKKVARLAIAKMEKGQMPPTITLEELNDLKIQL